MRSSSSSRFFSAAWQQQVLDARGHRVERSARARRADRRQATAILCVKSPCRTRSVPVKSACTDPVIDLASARPGDERDELDDQEAARR